MLKKFYICNIKNLFFSFFKKKYFFINLKIKDILYNVYFYRIKKKKFFFFFKFTYSFYKKKNIKYNKNVSKEGVVVKKFNKLLTKGRKFFIRKRSKRSFLKNIYFFKKKHFTTQKKNFFKKNNYNFFFFKYLKKNFRKKHFFLKYLKYRIKNSRNYLGGILFNTLKKNKLSQKFNLFRNKVNFIKIPIFFNDFFFFKKFFYLNSKLGHLPFIYKNSKFNFFFNYDNFFYNFNFMDNFFKNNFFKKKILLKKKKKKSKIIKNWKKDLISVDYINDYFYDYVYDYYIIDNLNVFKKNLFYYTTKLLKLNIFSHIKEYSFFYLWVFIRRLRFRRFKPDKWKNFFSYFKKLNNYKLIFNKNIYSNYKKRYKKRYKKPKSEGQKMRTMRYNFLKNNFLIYHKYRYKINRRFLKLKNVDEFFNKKIHIFNTDFKNVFIKYLKPRHWQLFKYIIFKKFLKKKKLFKKYKLFKLSYLNKSFKKPKLISYKLNWHYSSNVEKFKKKTFYKKNFNNNVLLRRKRKNRKIFFKNSPNLSIIYIDFLINTYIFKKNIYFIDYFKYFYMNILNIRTYNWKQII